MESANVTTPLNMKKKQIIILALILAVIQVILLPSITSATMDIGDVINSLNQTAVESHINQKVTVFGITGTFIFLLLGVLGSIFLLLVIFGGLTWMTAAG